MKNTKLKDKFSFRYKYIFSLTETSDPTQNYIQKMYVTLRRNGKVSDVSESCTIEIEDSLEYIASA